MPQSEELKSFFKEVATWILNIVADHNVAPRAFVGYKESGQRFAVILSGLPLQDGEQHGFVRTVLADEECVMYGYSSTMGKYDEDTDSVIEELHIGVATTSDCIFANWDVLRDENQEGVKLGKPQIYASSSPEKDPMTWNLALRDVPDDKRHDYVELWSSMRDKVLWIDPRR